MKMNRQISTFESTGSPCAGAVKVLLYLTARRMTPNRHEPATLRFSKWQH